MAKTRRPATEERRNDILRAALACFSERGYAATTLDEIRERSGASVGSIYHLFASKEEIAGAVYLEGMRRYQDGATALIVASATPEAAVRGSVAYFLAWVEDEATLARFVTNTRQTELVPTVKEELRAMNRAFFKTLREALSVHVERGVVKEMPWELFLAIVMGPAHEHVRHWLAGRSRTKPHDAAPVLADAAWAAVRVSDGAPERGTERAVTAKRR